MAVDEFSDYPVTGASGSQEYISPQDPSIEFTSKNPRGDYDPPQPNADYGVGATGNVSTSGRTNSGAPFIHPFKLEKFTNPVDNSTKVRVYEGDVYAKIDTFELAIITITTGVSHTHSAGGYTLPEHQHSAYDSSDSNKQLTIPDHVHEAGSSSTNLKAANHTHGFGVTVDTNTVTSSSGSSDPCHDTGHYHQVAISETTGNISSGTSLDVSGETAGVKNHSSDPDQKKVAGNTADVVPQSGSLPPITGTSGTNSNSPVDHKFVAVTGQAQAPLDVPTNFAGTFNKTLQFDDETDTIFKYHETAHSTGDFYVKWVITINEAAVVQTIVGSIERVAVGAGAPADSSFGELDQNPSTKALERTDLTGTFHQKIGSVTTTTVDQVQFSNINWSMTVLPEVS